MYELSYILPDFSIMYGVSEDMRKQHVLGMRVRKTRFRRLGHSTLQFRRDYIEKLDLLGLVHNFERSH